MPIVYGQPASNIAGLTLPNLPITQGKFGEVLDAKAHGDYYTGAYYGKTFIGSTAVAGTTIPVLAASLVSTFTLYNPLGSGVNLEVLWYDLGVLSATAVVGSIALAYQSGLAVAPLVPVSLTPTPALIGGAFAPLGKLYSSCTLAGTPTVLQSLGFAFGTTTAAAGPTFAHYEINGRILIAPGSLLVTTSQSAAQSAAMIQSLGWAEWPT